MQCRSEHLPGTTVDQSSNSDSTVSAGDFTVPF
jgi:hypothetical protein